MDESHKQEFAAMMYAFGDVYEVDFSKIMLGMWFDALGEYDINQIAGSIKRFMQNPDPTYGKPKPNDLIRLITGTSSDSSAIAWTKFDKALRMVGVYSSVCFDDPIIHKVIRDMGGWISFEGKDDDEWPFISNDFKARYKAYKTKKDTDGGGGYLVGVVEATNRRQGFSFDLPLLIGDKEKAKNVLELVGEQPFLVTSSENLQIGIK